MKLNGSWQRTLIGLLVFLMAMPAPIFAQSNIPVFRQEELDQILAPIALYPDSLLAQILMAATYPLEVVQADRWVKQNRNLPPEALNDALDRQNWDPSVKALVPFPDVLSMMSERLDWTQMVGDAFLAQEADVMETIQHLRARAYEAGNLRSTQQQTVAREGTVIIVEPANPQVVYVPVYSPMVVYGRWWYPAYPPALIRPYPPGAVVVAGIMTFGIGVAVASAWNHGWGYCNWGGRKVYVNVNRTININRTTTVIHTRDIRTTTWQHDPGHRRGVAYRDPGTREKFAPANRQALDNRRDYRGYIQSAPARPGTASRPGPETRSGSAVARPAPEAKPVPGPVRPAPETRTGPTAVDRPSTPARPETAVSRPQRDTRTSPVIIRPAPETKPGPAAVASPSVQPRPAQSVSRPAPPNTIYGVEQGSKAHRESARGRDSLSSHKEKGKDSSKPAAGAPTSAPAEKPASAQGSKKHDGGGRGRK
jgi:hypothetical protein